MIRFYLPARRRSTNFLLLVAITLVLSSCAHLVHLDKAQDSFNKGAEMENAALFNSASISVASPQAYYNIAYAEIDASFQNGGKGKLKKDNLLGTAYSIKALSAWKLKKYEEARNLSKSAMQYINTGSATKGTNVNYPRDYAVMKAMDALITIEESNDFIYVLLDTSNVLTADSTIVIYNQFIHNKDSTAKIETAIAQLDKVSLCVSEKHNVQTYFNMSQLAGLKVWSASLSKVKSHLKKQKAWSGANGKRDWYDQQEMLFKSKKDKYLESLANRLPEGKNSNVYLSWKLIL